MPAFRPLHGGNSMLDRLSHFLEGKHLDLPHALARDADFIREHSKWDRVFGQAPRFEDPALASVESRQGLFAVAVLAPALCQRVFFLRFHIGKRRNCQKYRAGRDQP